ncbi:MAG: hypothetical protein P8J78_11370 [Maricaulis sp.]|jgi:hypothetical protein|nr:hypothetical protein [Maricaulis sp.]MDG2045200.1 hypothetical protein [Maricaulis sp.]
MTPGGKYDHIDSLEAILAEMRRMWALLEPHLDNDYFHKNHRQEVIRSTAESITLFDGGSIYEGHALNFVYGLVFRLSYWERGEEFFIKTGHASSVLEAYFAYLTLDLACQWEAVTRADKEYSLARLHAKQEELLALIDPDWRDHARDQHEQTKAGP